MFKKMRRLDRELNKTDIEEILTHGEYGILSTMGTDGYPYGIPVNYVYMNGKIYFHCAGDAGHKVDNLNHCAKVCFTVVGKTRLMPEKFSLQYESIVAFGVAKALTQEKRQTLEKLIQKYSPEHLEAGLQYINRAIDQTAVYQITVEHVTGKGRKEQKT